MTNILTNRIIWVKFSNEFFRIDSYLTSNVSQTNAFYQLLDDHENQINQIFNILNFDKHLKKDKTFLSCVVLLKELTIPFTNSLRSEEEFLISILSVLVLKTLSIDPSRKIEDIENSFNSDVLINTISIEFQLIMIWFEWFRNEKILEKNSWFIN